MEEVEDMIKKGYDWDSIIAHLGKKGIARRTAIEYYNSANGTLAERLGKTESSFRGSIKGIGNAESFARYCINTFKSKT